MASQLADSKPNNEVVIIDMPEETVADIEASQEDTQEYYDDDSQAAEVGDDDIDEEEEARLLEMAQNDPEVNELMKHAPRPPTPPRPRPPSTVPTASRVGLPERLPPPPPPVFVIPPEPTRTQLAQETARNIGRVAAENAQRRMQQDNMTALRAQRDFKRQVENDPEIIKEKIQKVKMIYRYKKNYNGKIDHKFKTVYNPETLTMIAIDTEIGQIRECLNGGMVPDAIKGCVSAFANLVMATSLSAGSDIMDGYDDAVEIALNNHEFDDEIKQLSCELAEYFEVDPKWRLFWKLGGKAQETIKMNRPGLFQNMAQGMFKRQHPNAPTPRPQQQRPAVDPQMIARNRDL